MKPDATPDVTSDDAFVSVMANGKAFDSRAILELRTARPVPNGLEVAAAETRPPAAEEVSTTKVDDDAAGFEKPRKNRDALWACLGVVVFGIMKVCAELPSP